eukprot:gb/GECG01006437.1/.p1 GENE.gb/GECG01006437.1/~~gb/GECG01006437.1/.p1  ORF type:complete len:606 (+),score=142.82 gb/GECG01006437.1/:1-1818(+)
MVTTTRGKTREEASSSNTHEEVNGDEQSHVSNTKTNGKGKGGRLTKAQKRRLKKKERKQQLKQYHEQQQTQDTGSQNGQTQDDNEMEDAGTEAFVRDTNPDDLQGTEYEELADVIAKFMGPDELMEQEKEQEQQESTEQKSQTTEGANDQRSNEKAKTSTDEAGGDEINPEDLDESKLSHRKRKQLTRLTVAELKRIVDNPDVVEVHDVSASDPTLLVHLKSYRNAVPVPQHWQYKRRYLQGKTGMEKAPYKLPHFIEATGISRIRGTAEEQDQAKSIKQRQREKIRPKMGRIEIDYEVLHDAFFRHQTKPKMTGHGDLHYEGKEFEVRYDDKVPGVLSPRLKSALGMPEGAPPPWLINMQRYGPPPSYPNLNIPGLNAPIPEGASFGYHPGGWGKPPVDEFGEPIYGDVFGTKQQQHDNAQNVASGGEGEAPLDDNRWGEAESISDIESEEEEEAGQQQEGEEQQDESATTLGTATPADGTASVVSDMTGMQTPASSVQVRKTDDKDGMETPETTSQQPLYRVLEQKQTGVGNALVGTSYKYDIKGESGGTTDNSAAVRKAKSKAARQNDDEDDDEEEAVGSKRRRSDGATSQTSTKRSKEFKF